MSPPRSLRIGAARYSVTVEPIDETYGACEPRLQTISLNPNQGEDQMRDTLLHEVLHAIWATTTLCKTEADPYEEAVVQGLAGPLLDTLTRNPKLAEYLLG